MRLGPFQRAPRELPRYEFASRKPGGRYRTWGLLLGCAAVLTPSLTAQTIPAGDSGSLTARGVVLNQVTREPVRRALVYSPDNRFATLTDDRGRFALTFPPVEPDSATNAPADTDPQSAALRFLQARSNSRPTHLVARKPGYLPQRDQFARIPTDPTTELVLLLVPEGLINGHVHFSTVDNADRFQVELFQRSFVAGQEHWGSQGTFTTWSDGEFRFHDLPAGTYKLVSNDQLDRDPASLNPGGQAFGYRAGYYSNAESFDSAAAIQLTAGAAVQAELSAVRCEFYRVRLVVSNGPASGGAQVRVYPQGHPGPGYSLGFNANEQRIEGLLPDGAYTVEVSTAGEPRLTGILDFTVRGGPTEGPVVAMKPDATLTGYVRADFSLKPETGRPAPETLEDEPILTQEPDVEIYLIPTDSFRTPETFTATTEENKTSKSFQLANVPPGQYWVHGSTENGYIASILRAGVDLLRQPLVVAGEAGEPIEVTLRNDGAELSGTVTSPQEDGHRGGVSDTGDGQKPVFVYLLPLNYGEGQLRAVPTLPDSTFQLQQIPPGTYRVLAFAQQQEELEGLIPQALPKYESKGQVVYLSPGKKVTLPSPLEALRE